MLKPDWRFLFTQKVTPSLSLESGYLYMVIGIVGTTITPWMQFYLLYTLLIALARFLY